MEYKYRLQSQRKNLSDGRKKIKMVETSAPVHCGNGRLRNARWPQKIQELMGYYNKHLDMGKKMLKKNCVAKAWDYQHMVKYIGWQRG